MAKIVLQQEDKSFTIITNKLSRFWLPCLGESDENWYFEDGEWRKYVNGKRME